MIISLRGTHGSGKSYLVRQVLAKYHATPESVDKRGRPQNYVMTLRNGARLYVVGSYVNECGGCDSIQPYAEIWPRVTRLAKLGHVLFEGALISNSYGNIGRDSEVYGAQFVFAFLDTPLAVCIQRIVARRQRRGNTKPFDPNKSVVRIYHSNQAVLAKAQNQFGRAVVLLDYRKPLPQLLGLLYRP